MLVIGRWFAVNLEPRPHIIAVSVGYASTGAQGPTLAWVPEGYGGEDQPTALQDVVLMTPAELKAEEWGVQALSDWEAGELSAYWESLEGTLDDRAGPGLSIVPDE